MPIEHQLFAAAKDPDLVPPDDRAKRRGQAKPRTDVFHYWAEEIPFFARAMVLAGGKLFLAGPADLVDEEEAAVRLADPEMLDRLRRQEETYRGAHGGLFRVVSADTGDMLSEWELDTIPVFDGMAAAGGRLYLSGVDGRLISLEGR